MVHAKSLAVRQSRAATIGLVILAAGIAGIFAHLGRQPSLKTHVPEFIALSLVAGALYTTAVYMVERLALGPVALLVILGAAVIFRILLLPVQPQLSDDVYRYQWEGRVERAGLNPYTVFPASPGLSSFQEPGRPLGASLTTSTIYPPVTEWIFSRVKSIPGYKRLFVVLDLASLGVLLMLLARRGQPPHRVLAYAWNPTVVVSFALCGHCDSLAIATLLAANLLMITHRRALSITFLAASFLAKFFPLVLLPAFLNRVSRVRNGRGSEPLSRSWLDQAPVPAALGLFGAIVGLGYAPYLGAGRRLVGGLSDYAAGWEANDSVFRMVRAAGNSKAQAELIVAVVMAALVVYALRSRMSPLRTSLFLTSSLVLLSPTAFPWYFTWSIPFLCFYSSGPWLLMSVTAVLGYAPVVAYASGQPYRDSTWVLGLEYAPVLVWLGIQVATRRPSR